MSSDLQQRLKQVNSNLANAPVSIDDMHPELLKIAAKLCDHFQVGYGSLIRRAWSIAVLDGRARLELEHIQEAVQHIILMDDICD